MLPRNFQKGKPYTPKKTQQAQGQGNNANNNYTNNNGHPSYDQNNYYQQDQPQYNPTAPQMNPGTLHFLLACLDMFSIAGYGYPTTSAFPDYNVPPIATPMQYYGEVPLAPMERKEGVKVDKPTAQSKKYLRTAGADIWEDPTLAEWSQSTLLLLFLLFLLFSLFSCPASLLTL
jgi:hypothetical protein